MGTYVAKIATKKHKVRSKISYWFLMVKTPMKDLNDLYIFTLIVKHGGLSKVEEKTDISKSIEISVSYFFK
ncbi:hypothetical protein [Acinetobacter seifertii]|uniref:hypothetical protein n=1 Tax=Acinetobacter seifertii TaxID=1530123 RepID=UPI001F4CCE78|nr:hypothetical protein [Acinetobacter seifertii]